MKPFWCIVLFCFVQNEVNGLIVEGEIQTLEEWAFLTRFCYLSRSGMVRYEFQYPVDFCCQEAILYFDDQWPKVYPQPEKTCMDKRGVTHSSQILRLHTFSSSNCSLIEVDGKKVIKCYGYRTLHALRARWWYIVVSKCGSVRGLVLQYRLEMTNGKTFWTKHFSADEKNILETDLIFCCLTVLVVFMTLYVSVLLRRRQLLHTTFKMFLTCVFLELLSIIMNIVFYVDYGETGLPSYGMKNLARGVHFLSDILFVILLILLGKGFTVTRGRISATGQVKLSVFCTFYGIAYIGLFIYEAKAFDPAKVLYIYESPAGMGICILRIVGWSWFCYGVYFTLKHYNMKKLFYIPFWFFYTMWFLSGPLVVLMASYVFEPYMRAQVMNAVDRVVAILAFIFFLVLTRPSQANTNFPYHVRTTQIGILDEGSATNVNFSQHSYAPGNDIQHKNITVLFSVIKSENATCIAENGGRFDGNIVQSLNANQKSGDNYNFSNNNNLMKNHYSSTFSGPSISDEHLSVNEYSIKQHRLSNASSVGVPYTIPEKNFAYDVYPPQRNTNFDGPLLNDEQDAVQGENPTVEPTSSEPQNMVQDVPEAKPRKKKSKKKLEPLKDNKLPPLKLSPLSGELSPLKTDETLKQSPLPPLKTNLPE